MLLFGFSLMQKQSKFNFDVYVERLIITACNHLRKVTHRLDVHACKIPQSVYRNRYSMKIITETELHLRRLRSKYTAAVSISVISLSASDNSIHQYLGSACSGIVTQVETNFDHRFKLCHRAGSMVEGSFRTFAHCNAAAVTHIPDGVSYTSAAALPVVFATADYCLHLMARLQRGETIMIHSGSVGLGQACIQLAQIVGADIYTTVGSDIKGKQVARQLTLLPILRSMKL